MIIHTGMRTDIPAFYAKWFSNRLREGFVLVRNPFNQLAVTRYELTPDLVDLICFCTKNPSPMFDNMNLLEPFHQYWFVTITPYGREFEPRVPDKADVMESFKRLSDMVGVNCVGWRYDPIIIDKEWTAERHIEEFSRMARELSGYTKTCVISFVDRYEKVKVNFPEVRTVPLEDQMYLTEKFVDIATPLGFTIKPCGESKKLEAVGADCSGCMTVQVYEDAIGQRLSITSAPKNRKECACYLTGDIGQYNTCGHLCKYCYANVSPEAVRKNMSAHDPESPFLIGNLHPEDVIHQAKQTSFINPQMRLDDLWN